MPTDFVSHRESRVKAVVLDDGTASFWGADGADVRHAQSIAGVMATEILRERGLNHHGVWHFSNTRVHTGKSVPYSSTFDIKVL